MYGSIKTLKHSVGTTLRLAYHGCKNLTHTSKTCHVKRTQMVELLGSRFPCLLLFLCVAYSSLLEAALDLETLGLSLYSLLVNTALRSMLPYLSVVIEFLGNVFTNLIFF